MLNKVQITAVFFIASLLSACGSPKYGPYQSSTFAAGTGGYSEKRISNGEWEVEYSGKAYKTYKLALFRAAEISVNQGFSGFELIGVRFEPNGMDGSRGYSTLQIKPSNNIKSINYHESVQVEKDIKNMNPEFF